jgi:predicted glutamine amidotransferase
MCLIIVDNTGGLTREGLRQAWVSNPDGSGYAYADNGAVKIRKPFFRFREFIKAYEADRRAHSGAFLIHFRIRTHGKLSKLNTHPHRLAADCAMAHNGIFREFDARGLESDTVLFCRMMFAARSTENIMGIELQHAFEQRDKQNKVALLDGSGRVVIWNSRLWDDVDGNWYSNLYHWNVRTTHRTQTDRAQTDRAQTGRTQTNRTQTDDGFRDYLTDPYTGYRPDEFDNEMWYTTDETYDHFVRELKLGRGDR